MKKLSRFGGHVVRQVGALIVHGQNDSRDREPRVEVSLDTMDGGYQITDPFEREILALERYQNLISRGQRVDRQMSERGRTVQQDVVVLMTQLVDRPTEPFFPPGMAHKFDLDADQFSVGWKNTESLEVGGADSLRRRTVAGQYLIEVRRISGDAEPSCRVTLRIAIHQQDAFLKDTERSGEVDRGGGFPDPALLIG